jgi:hypothetical protein
MRKLFNSLHGTVSIERIEPVVTSTGRPAAVPVEWLFIISIIHSRKEVVTCVGKAPASGRPEELANRWLQNLRRG